MIPETPETPETPDASPPDTIVDILGDHAGLRALLPAGTAPVSADAPVRFKIRLAGSAGERNRASFLIEKRYAWRGYPLAPERDEPGGVTLRVDSLLSPLDRRRALREHGASLKT